MYPRILHSTVDFGETKETLTVQVHWVNILKTVSNSNHYLMLTANCSVEQSLFSVYNYSNILVSKVLVDTRSSFYRYFEKITDHFRLQTFYLKGLKMFQLIFDNMLNEQLFEEALEIHHLNGTDDSLVYLNEKVKLLTLVKKVEQ